MKLFVDTHRKPEHVYSDPKNWTVAKNSLEFRTIVHESLANNEIPLVISFDYDLENESEGLNCLQDFVNTAIKLRLSLPKIYLHCNDRRLAIDFENALNQYTKKTSVPYTFEYTKRD
ncbi:MAG: hypothetical protein SLAVMIC_00641 [uncultured marine phage]|uniref:Cyclic-phosphate processing Receiver domain-containing protein n=1 Tax=uncultured marine phage TaxID=707152 RepID=A0A8D9CEK1_9VIRU|nr:MAG: hypothetical protein SLAVMIC_00641 [uncultured marine phage]